MNKVIIHLLWDIQMRKLNEKWRTQKEKLHNVPHTTSVHHTNNSFSYKTSLKRHNCKVKTNAIELLEPKQNKNQIIKVTKS